jgi:phage/plasmid-associated DNA primase
MSDTSYIKVIREVLERFQTEENVENLDENMVWTLYDYQTSRVCSLPHGTAATVLGNLFDLQQEKGYLHEGEPIYYLGEKIGNTRSLRIEFSGVLKDTVEESTVFKMIISAIVMLMDEMFEASSTKRESRICTILLSSDQSYSLDFTLLFPYCRMKREDFVCFMDRLEKMMDERFSENVYEAFNGVNSFGDILKRDNTFGDTYPLFGCARHESDYVMDKYQVWVIDKIPGSLEEIPDAPIEQVDEEEVDQILPLNNHFLITNRNIVISNPVQSKKWRPLTLTNAYYKQRLIMKKAPEEEVYTFGSRVSPFTRSISERRSQNRSRDVVRADEPFEDFTHRVLGYYKDIAAKKTPSTQLSKMDEARIVKSVQSKKVMQDREMATEIQKIINLFAKENKWFDITSNTQSPPIKVGQNGFHLEFKHLDVILDKLDGKKRCAVTSELEDLACIIYTVAGNNEEHEEARHLFINFVRNKSPAEFRNRGEEAGLSNMYNRQIKRACKGRLTFWTLLEMFKEDMPLYYTLWWRYIYDYYLLHILENDMASFSVAKAASLPLVGKFIHSTGDAKATWWKYTGTRWENIYDVQKVELFVTTQLVMDIQCLAHRYDVKSFSASSGKTNYDVVKGNLQKTGLRSSVMRDIAMLLHDNRVVDFSDGSDPEYADFFASHNFVYQYSDGEMKRRPGRWEDFLTKCFDVIDECLPITDPKCQFIIEWVHKMLRDKETEHEFLKEISTCVRGFNRHKRFSVWYGFGNGGKSKFMDLFSSTLGLKNGHAVKIPLESMLEGGKKNAGAASPEIDQARNAFLAIYDEPKKGQKFDAGKIKATTGNDPQYSRTLFSKGGSFRPMFKSVLLGNIVPKADFDDAMKTRFWVWNFKGKFVDPSECPSDPEEQERIGVYPLDYDLDTKLPEYRAAMLSVLLHYFKIYSKEGIRKTNDIIRATDQFWNSANDVLCFIHENLVETEDKECTIPTDEVYDAFRRWFMNRNNGERVVTKIGFLDELMAIKTDQNVKSNGGLMGYRFRDI